MEKFRPVVYTVINIPQNRGISGPADELLALKENCPLWSFFVDWLDG